MGVENAHVHWWIKEKEKRERITYQQNSETTHQIKDQPHAPTEVTTATVTHTHRQFGDPMPATSRLQSSRPLAGVLPESLCDVTSWLMVSLSILSPPPAPPLPKVRDSCLLIFLILSMSGGREGRGGREAEGGGAASLETAPGQVG